MGIDTDSINLLLFVGIGTDSLFMLVFSQLSEGSNMLYLYQIGGNYIYLVQSQNDDFIL